MQKSLRSLGGFRRTGLFRQGGDNGSSDLDCVLHFALGKTGMSADALNGDGGGIRGKGLVLNISGSFAVDSVGKIGAEFFQVDLVDSATDLFVRCEQDLDGAVLDLWIVDQETRRIHDFGNAGLVVGAEQRGAIGRYDIVAGLVFKRRMIRD